MLEPTLNKKTIATALVFAGIVTAFLTLDSQVKANEFVGVVQGIEGSHMMVKGVYVVEGKEAALDDQKEVWIEAGSNTKFVKTLIYYPTAEELRADPEGQRKTKTVDGTMDDITLGRADGIFIKSSKNIYRSKKFTADEIRYIWTVYPGQE